jgi:hypothetical protein
MSKPACAIGQSGALCALLALAAAGCATPRSQAPQPQPPAAVVAVPAVDADSPAQQARFAAQRAAYDADIAQKTHPERLTHAGTVTPFDRDAWNRDPLAIADAYARIAEVGRAFQPGTDAQAPILDLAGDAAFQIPAGGSTAVAFRALPHAPVSLYISGGGKLPSGLGYGTLVADAQGLATVRINCAGGVHHEVDLIASSPVLRGSVRAQITVTPAVLAASKP